MNEILEKLINHIIFFKQHLIEKCVQSNSPDNCTHHYNVEILNIFDPELQ